MAKVNRKNFLLVALAIWLIFGFIAPNQPVENESVQDRIDDPGDQCFGNFTCAVIEESKSVGTQLLDVVFAGFNGMSDFLQDHILWVSAGIGILLVGFIGFKK